MCCNVQADGNCPNNALFNVRAWVSTLGWWNLAGGNFPNDAPPNDGAVLLVTPAAPSAITPVPLPLTSLFGQQVVTPQEVTSTGFPGASDATCASQTFRQIRAWSADTAPVTSLCEITNGAALDQCVEYIGDVCGGNSGGSMVNNNGAFGICSFGESGCDDNGQSRVGFTQVVSQGQNEGAWLQGLIGAAAAAVPPSPLV